MQTRARAEQERRRRLKQGFTYTIRQEGDVYVVSVAGPGASFEIKGTDLLAINLELDLRGIVHEGSSSSSKTYSAVQAHVIRSFLYPRRTISVVRKTLPALKKSAIKDIRDILSDSELWKYFKENKSEGTFTNTLTKSVIEFFGLDDPQKARGPRRHDLHATEANELTEEDLRQLMLRSSGKIYIDYNPSMLRSYLYDKIIPRDDFTFEHSTYKRNPFLSQDIIREIEADVPVYSNPETDEVFGDWDNEVEKGEKKLDGWVLQSGDPYRWAVYGLGQRGTPSEAIFPYCYESPGMPNQDTVYGLDFGFKHYMALVEVSMHDAAPKPELHIQQHIFETGLTMPELIGRMKSAGISDRKPIYCDSQRQDNIKMLKDAGYWAVSVEKGPGSVFAGITYLKEFKLCFTRTSDQSKAQCQDYRWKKKPDGEILDEPVKLNDDAPDAIRYAAFGHWGRSRPKSGGTVLLPGTRIRR